VLLCRLRICAIRPSRYNCNTLQHTATHCNTLQHTATHCNRQTPVLLCCPRIFVYVPSQVRLEYCNTLQHPATHCNTRQHPASQRRCSVYPDMCLHALSDVLDSHICNLQYTTSEQKNYYLKHLYNMNELFIIWYLHIDRDVHVLVHLYTYTFRYDIWDVFDL